MVQSSTGNLPLFLQMSGWGILSTSIIQNKHQLRYYKEGLTLCTFAMNYLEGNRENKLSYTMLELRIDCLKSLSEFFLNNNIELNSNFRELIKNLLNGGFDICKENVKESLKEEGFLFTR